MTDTPDRDPRFAEGRGVIALIILSLACMVGGGLVAYTYAMLGRVP